MKSTSVVLSIFAALFVATQAAAQTVVTIGLVSPLSAGLGGPVGFARDLGFLKAEDIEIEFVPFQGSAVMLPQLASKRITVGWPNPDPIIISHDTGKDPLPVKMIYNCFRTSVWEFVVPVDSDITELKQLKGKRLGVFGPSSGNVPITRALMADLGIDLNKDIELVPVGAGAGVTIAMNTKKVDALNHYTAQLMLTEESGVKMRRIPQPEKYARLFANGFAAHEDTIRNQADLLARFGRAYTKGVIACEANPAACSKAFWKHYPARKPGIYPDDAKNLAFTIRLLEGALHSYLDFAPGAPHRHGSYDAKTWRDFIDVLYAGGQLKSKAIDPALLYTNALVDGYNKFDAAAVVAAAKAVR